MRRYPFLSPDDTSGPGDPAKGAADPVKPDDTAALRAKLAEYEAADVKRRADAAKADEDAAKKRGDFEKLLADKDAKIATLAELEKREAARIKRVGEKVEARIKALPKDRQSLVPDVLKADPDALADYLETNWALLSGQPAGEGTDKPGHKPKPSEMSDADVPADIAEQARMRGLAPAAWYKVLVHAGRIKPATA